MTRDELLARLVALEVDGERLSWVRAAPETETAESIWRRCASAPWMLGIAVKVGINRTLLIEAACDCADWACGSLPAGEYRPQAAIAAARRWTQGGISAEGVREAARGAQAAVHTYVNPVDRGLSDSAASDAYEAAWAAVHAIQSVDEANPYAPVEAARSADPAGATSIGTFGPAIPEVDSLIITDLYGGRASRSLPGMVRARIPWVMLVRHLRGGTPISSDDRADR